MVIGSGAAGGVMAKQLSIAGFSVVVLEQGPWGAYGHEQDYNKDELDQPFPGSEDDRLISNPKTQRNTFRRNASEKAGGPRHHIYGCVVGGGTVTYGAAAGGICRGSSTRPAVFGGHRRAPASPTGRSPMRSSSLTTPRPNGRSAFRGQRVDTPSWRRCPSPIRCRRCPSKAPARWFKVAAAKLGLTVVPNVAAIITEPYNGPHALHQLRHVLAAMAARSSARSCSAVALLPIAVATGIARSARSSYVREISVDNSGKVTGAVYFDKAARTARCSRRPRWWCSVANGTETPRLLLLSKSNRFPQGLANSSGVVGKYLMSGNGGGASGLFEHPLNEYKGCVTGAAILDYVPNDVKRRGFYGGGRMTARGFTSPDRIRAARARTMRRAGARPTRRR